MFAGLLAIGVLAPAEPVPMKPAVGFFDRIEVFSQVFSLRGIAGVVVESGAPRMSGAETRGADSAVVALRAQILGAGIRVLTKEEASRPPANPRLQVRLLPAEEHSGLHQFKLSLDLYERYCLARMPDSCTFMKTWSGETTFGVFRPPYPSGRIASEKEAVKSISAWKAQMAVADSQSVALICEFVRELGDTFIGAYRRANPDSTGLRRKSR